MAWKEHEMGILIPDFFSKSALKVAMTHGIHRRDEQPAPMRQQHDSLRQWSARWQLRICILSFLGASFWLKFYSTGTHIHQENVLIRETCILDEEFSQRGLKQVRYFDFRYTVILGKFSRSSQMDRSSSLWGILQAGWTLQYRRTYNRCIW